MFKQIPTGPIKTIDGKISPPNKAGDKAINGSVNSSF